MGFRMKIGPYLSIGKTGLRVHAGTRRFSASTGASGTRAYVKVGPFYFTKG